MINKLKEIDIKKNRTHYFFDGMISIKDLDPNKFKIHEKWYQKNILVYHIGYVTIKDLSYAITNNVKPLYLIISKINWYIEESHGN